MTHALSHQTPALLKSAVDYPVFRIAKGETNKFVLLIDPLKDATGFIQVIEIFDVGGFTPPNQHQRAEEVFYILHGEGIATTGDTPVKLRPGSTLLLRPGSVHAVRNTGKTRLYCLTTMVPDEGFAALITSGVADALDAEDCAVLGWG